MKTHTPGPWRRTGPNVRSGDALICYATNHHADAETPEPEKLANACLIAAAPDLLAALEIILSSTCGDIGEDGHDGCIRIEVKSLDRAREAISKATGGAK